MKNKNEKQKRKSPLRYLKWGAFPPIFLLTALGILLLIFHEERALSIAIAILLSASGIALLSGAFLCGKAEWLMLFFGAIVLAFAVWLFVAPSGALSALVYLLAALLLFRALFGICGSFSATGYWRKIQCCGCLILLVFGVVLLFLPLQSFHSLFLLAGIFLLLDALLEFFSRLRGLIAPSGKKSEKIKIEEEGTKRNRKREKKQSPPPEEGSERKRDKDQLSPPEEEEKKRNRKREKKQSPPPEEESERKREKDQLSLPEEEGRERNRKREKKQSPPPEEESERKRDKDQSPPPEEEESERKRDKDQLSLPEEEGRKRHRKREKRYDDRE